MAHQSVGLARLSGHPEAYALGCEQGTGKTWMLLADAERRYLAGEIDALFVIAPKGVHTNWVRREIPRHLGVPHVAEAWLSGAGVKHTRRLERLLKAEDGLVICAMNVDAVNAKGGLEYARRFLQRFRTMFVVDESQRIKNPGAKRTRRVLELGELATARRISSGTLVANSPLDLFAQYEFLSSGLLGTTSYRAFTAEYADLLPPGHPLVSHIAAGRRGSPQIVRKDSEGRPVYRNLEKLRRLMAPVTYRVTKEECLDLPEKIYQTVDFELEPEQRRLYEQVKAEVMFRREDGAVDTFTALTLISKLQQLTSGFILVDGEPTELANAGPRMRALREVVEDSEGQIIVWARFRAELARIARELADYGVVEYHGGISPKDREAAVDAFQSGAARIFVANPAAGGTGLTLHAASTVIYHSCSFSLEERLQSEGRAHRIGTRHPVVYIDLVATDTVDERIAAALQAKAGVAEQILEGL
jgi:SNF2 family DNA or RNA helicase